ncbi:uncharacterized protein EV422DRAFT_582645 [Fimicolochytrium jonesii]|uniref:uncharacterized protein n=1 Tax=Fimicolochytrium jonesii TaxID=1396493 RepID=UPI0022FE3969|nr:uncharacterized protein EV422DRAFT_582645 [Fimicolochytrium jonesii]KAI8827015.1 hypothetical protein EV422DRAFT_582645 [Fimicolochytrium jonesii]
MSHSISNDTGFDSSTVVGKQVDSNAAPSDTEHVLDIDPIVNGDGSDEWRELPVDDTATLEQEQNPKVLTNTLDEPPEQQHDQESQAGQDEQQPQASKGEVQSAQKPPKESQLTPPQRNQNNPAIEKNWLLRFFQSDFFDPRIALSYLHRYPESIGIQHYICDRLNEFPVDEVEFFLPQLCHLAITSQNESVALENFLLKQCKRSQHCAVLTFWLLQAHLNDLRALPQSESYRLCQRLYYRCQVLMFTDDYTSKAAGSPAPTTAKIEHSWNPFQKKKMRENVRPAVVGIGAVLAAGVCPLAVDAGREMILSQGRRWKDLAHDTDGPQTSAASTKRSDSVRNGRSVDHVLGQTSKGRRHSTEIMSQEQRQIDLAARIPIGSPSPDELSRGGAFSFNRYVAKAIDTTKSPPKTPVRHQPQQRSSSMSNVVDQSFYSNLLTRPSGSKTSPNHPDLERSHYFHAEMQFMMTLVEISDRLRTVPKEARQSTLIAELELLNHNLPANVCLTPWCRASATHPAHHRIARISPSDAVVLNSADRVPYLITVEVLESTDQDNAAESRVVEKRRSRASFHGDYTHDPDEAESRVRSERRSMDSQRSVSWATEATTPAEYHRMVLNRRKSNASITSRTSMSPLDATPTSPLAHPGKDPLDISNKAAPAPPTPADEFTERLRTAAVMLAQLYRQQQRDVSSQGLASPTAQSSTMIVGAGGIPAPLLSPRQSSQAADTNIVNVPASQAVNKDKRNYQKLKADFESIKNRLIKEMVTLEEARVKALAQRMNERASLGAQQATDDTLPETEESLRARCQERDKDDPSAAVFRETWDAKMERIRASSPYGRQPNWRLFSVIVKSGADLRQEQLALQLIKEMQRIWRAANVPVWVCYFQLLITSEQSGIMETIRDSISVHSIKKNAYAKQMNENGLPFTLYDYFVKEFGHPGSTRFGQAQDNFMRSLAAYSVICYLLQIKDSPGSVGFELAPFKLPQEYVDILGGLGSEKFREFRELMKECFLALRKEADEIVALVKLMEHGSSLPCFTGVTPKPSNMPTPSSHPTTFINFAGSEYDLQNATGAAGNSAAAAAAQAAAGTAANSHSQTAAARTYPVSAALRERFLPGGTKDEACELVESLIDRSCGSAFTRMYDSFQVSVLSHIASNLWRRCGEANTLWMPLFQYYANGVL